MNEFTPEQKKLTELRKANDKELVQGGAHLLFKRDPETGNSHKRLHLTKEQETDAIVEMKLDEQEKAERGVTVRQTETYEIKESRTFKAEEIIDTIAEYEGLNPRDLLAYESVETKNGDLTNAAIKLNTEDPSSKYFGYKVTYIFEIKGSSEDSADLFKIPHTHIARLVQSAESEEKVMRAQVDLEYASTEKEKDEVIKRIEREDMGMQSDDLLIFDGHHWKKVKEDSEGKEPWQK